MPKSNEEIIEKWGLKRVYIIGQDTTLGQDTSVPDALNEARADAIENIVQRLRIVRSQMCLKDREILLREIADKALKLQSIANKMIKKFEKDGEPFWKDDKNGR